MEKLKYFFFLIINLIFFVTINSCGPVKEWPTEPDKPALGKGTKVRFVNLILDNPPIDIYVNNARVYSYSTFKLATYYFDLNPGQHEIKITRHQETDYLVKDTVKLDTNKFYLISFIGSGSNLKIKLYETGQLNPNNEYATVRFINGFSEVDSIDVSIFNQTDNFNKVPKIV